MTLEDMDVLEEASGKAFDTVYLQLMVITKASSKWRRPSSPTAPMSPPRTWPTTSCFQSAEITRMNKLLGAG
ncbi:hypothetical protein GCM10010264_21640 [Streptomyces globisporus]|nr:hypothetical protein GCM10010264_21640 [Streptomyces globisporus]